MPIRLPDRCEQMQAFLRRVNARPLLGFFVGTYYPLHRYRGAATLPQGMLSPQDVSPAAYLADCDHLHAAHAACPGDLLWTATAFWGIPWLEAAIGCPVEVDHVTGSCRSHPPVSADWPTVPRFSPENPWVARCLEMLRSLSEHAAGRYPLGVTLMRGVSDLLSALLGVDRLVFAMLDEPARVHALAEALTEFWIAFAHAQLDVIPSFAGGCGSFFYNLWAPGRCVWLQEDTAALLSPALYEEFILPCDRRIASAFDYTFIHLHPARYVPYAHLLESDASVIELHIDKEGPRAKDLLPVYRHIQKHKPLFVWGDMTSDDLDILLGSLDPRGLAIQVVVRTPKEAQQVYARYRL